MKWLTNQFGRDKLRDAPIILPIARFFPDPYDASDEAIRLLLARVCGYMGIAADTIHFSLYEDRPPVETDGLVKGTAGLYSEEHGAFRIWLEEKNLDDPLALVATMAHELGHVLLLGHGRVSADEWDHEPLTDLLTVFLGLGVITANSVVRESSWTSGGWGGWTIGRRGYLTMPMYGYALAVFAHLRGETKPKWARHLRPDVRAAFKLGEAWIVSEGGLSGTPAAPTFDHQQNQNLTASEPIDIDSGDSTPRCSFCGSTSDVQDTDTGQMCDACRDSTATNLEELVAQSDDDPMRVYARTIVRTFALLVAIGFVFLIGRWLVLSVFK